MAPDPCPQCGQLIPTEALQGLCPRCALAAVDTATEAGQPSGERPRPPSLDALSGAFPQLEILEWIGTGGMGAVYKARQPRLDRLVAVKVLSPALAGSPQFAERFHREARLLARLHHSGIVSVYDYGEAGGFYYLMMEYVDGVNLRQAMKAGRFSPAQALALIPGICDALQYAHDEGILHRDIKPENILLDTRGRVKIADFGIAKLLGNPSNEAALTGSGLAVGTPHYMAPEQLEHPQDVDQRADIYSVGVVFYEMLTGELPMGRFAPPSHKTPMDSRVDEVVLRALEKERDRRQRNITEIKTGVERITGTAASSHTTAASMPESDPPPRTSFCYVSTPEYLRTFRGRFLYIYQGNGQLRLDARNLGFSSGWQNVTIPLTSIRSLARGEHSLAAKPIPLHYLEVTFEDQGTRRTLLFTPTRSGLLPAWETNKDVAEWIAAIQAAAEQATGRPMSLSGSSGSGRGWGEMLQSLGLTALICSLVFLAIPIVVEQRLPNRWTDYLPGPLLAVMSLGLGLGLRFWMERRASKLGNLDALTHPPESSNPRVGDPGGIAELKASTVGTKNTARTNNLGWNLCYLVIFLALCFLMVGPWIGDFTGRPFPYPMPESVGKPVAWLTLLLVVYGAVHKSWRGTHPPGNVPIPGHSGHGTRPMPGVPAQACETPAPTGERHTLHQGRLDSFTGEEPPESCAYPATDHSLGPNGLSWRAVASAACSIPAWLLVIGLLTELHDSLGSDGLPPRGFSIATFELLILATGGFVGLAGLFLGAEALREIRHSNGAMRGARLAVIGLVGIPTGMMIKFLPALAAALARTIGWQPTEIPGQVFVGCVLIGILMGTALAAWALRRWARYSEGSPLGMRSGGGIPT